MFISMKFLLVFISSIALCLASGSDTDRQSFSSAITGTSLIKALTSIPRAIGNILPMFFLFGLGALMVPALGLAMLLREGGMSRYSYYYRSLPSFKIDTSAIIDGASDLLERVVKALDDNGKKYD
ncbi:uncharacterized protein LOC141849948 [Brevipalpus obovatus]|uniref:uncharacterized protein LOC141849948 n=1 Tax=Brevipalpus obovatus TaxID=246614 RepID=UPI003D9ED488